MKAVRCLVKANIGIEFGHIFDIALVDWKPEGAYPLFVSTPILTQKLKIFDPKLCFGYELLVCTF